MYKNVPNNIIVIIENVDFLEFTPSGKHSLQHRTLLIIMFQIPPEDERT